MYGQLFYLQVAEISVCLHTNLGFDCQTIALVFVSFGHLHKLLFTWVAAG